MPQLRNSESQFLAGGSPVDPIQVPAPPRSAYNPNRRVSDLIVGQLSHFQHLEQKHGNLGIDPALSRDIHTEAGAARYITAITRALRGQTSAPAKLAVLPAAKTAKKRATSSPRLAIAASAAPPARKAVKKAAKAAAKGKK